MIISIQILAYILIPILIIRYRKFTLTKWFGMIGTAYIAGIMISLLIFALKKTGISIDLDNEIGEIVSHAAIAIAIPLLLFSANLKETKKVSRTVLLSFASLTVSVILVSAIAFYVYGRHIENGAVLSAMSIGLYTGGTPNLNAIGNIFGLDQTAIGIANLSDMIIGGVFYVFLLVLCKPLLLKFLKPSNTKEYMKEASDIANTEELDFKEHLRFRPLFFCMLLSLGMAIVSAAIGIGLWVLLGAENGKMNDYLVPAMMIGVTVFGIIASFNQKVRSTKGTNIIGQYLILVFSFALASSLDLSRMQNNLGSTIVLYGSITVGAFLLHILFSKVLKVDVDCAMVTATAGIYGPAFIPALTKQIKNDALTVPGLICGSLGYAIGTFLGFAFGLLYLL